MNPTVDYVYLVIARFERRLEIWRAEAFSSYDEALAQWESHVLFNGSQLPMELVRIVQVNLDVSGGVGIVYASDESMESPT